MKIRFNKAVLALGGHCCPSRSASRKIHLPLPSNLPQLLRKGRPSHWEIRPCCAYEAAPASYKGVCRKDKTAILLRKHRAEYAHLDPVSSDAADVPTRHRRHSCSV